MATSQRIMTAEEIVALAGAQPAFLRMPEAATVFATRADRLAALANGHPMSAYLELVRAVAAAQQKVLDAYPGDVVLPDETARATARAHAMPLLAAQSWSRHESWRRVVRTLCAAVAPQLDGQARAVAQRVGAADDAWLETEADRILNHYECDRGAAVFVAAGMQVYWTRMVTLLGGAAFDRIDVAGVCPCCGARPVASVLRPGAGGMHRYLACSLCAAEWNMVRIKCAVCESTKDIAYYNVEQGGEAIKAEACDECRSYVKILYCDKDPMLEPVADDLASIALDFLMADTTHYQRASVNLALFPGEESPPGTAQQAG